MGSGRRKGHTIAVTGGVDTDSTIYCVRHCSSGENEGNTRVEDGTGKDGARTGPADLDGAWLAVDIDGNGANAYFPEEGA